MTAIKTDEQGISGEAHLAQGDGPQVSVASVRSGLRLLVRAGREQRAAVALRSAVSDLRAHGRAAEAEALLKEFAGLARVAATMQASTGASPRGHLPPKCANCGGALRADEVKWIDDATAECPYCGSGVRTEP